jgi:hypothetical protein
VTQPCNYLNSCQYAIRWFITDDRVAKWYQLLLKLASLPVITTVAVSSYSLILAVADSARPSSSTVNRIYSYTVMLSPIYVIHTALPAANVRVLW